LEASVKWYENSALHELRSPGKVKISTPEVLREFKGVAYLMPELFNGQKSRGRDIELGQGEKARGGKNWGIA